MNINIIINIHDVYGDNARWLFVPTMTEYRQTLSTIAGIVGNSVPMYLSIYVCLQDLLMRLSCRPQQTKNSVHYCLPVTPFPTSTAWRQHYVRVSRNVSPTVIVQVSHAIYLTIIISPPLWRCDIVTTIAAPGKKDYRLDGVGIGLQSAQWIDPAGRRADDNKLSAWEWQTDKQTDRQTDGQTQVGLLGVWLRRRVR